MTRTCRKCGVGEARRQIGPGVSSVADWWRDVHELEEGFGYEVSSLSARKAWDELLAAEILAPREALYVELRDCLATWKWLVTGAESYGATLLDRLVWTADREKLQFPHYAPLAAFRLRQQLRRIAMAGR